MPHNFFKRNTYNYILTGVASRCKVAWPLRTKKSSEVVFGLEAIYKKGGAFIYPKAFQIDNASEFKNEVTKLLKNTMLIFEGQQGNINTPIQPLWKL